MLSRLILKTQLHSCQLPKCWVLSSCCDLKSIAWVSWSIVGRLKWVDARLLRQHEDSDAQIFMIEHATDHSSSCLLLIPDKVLKKLHCPDSW